MIDINSINIQRSNSAYVPFANADASRGNTDSGFGDLLRKLPAGNSHRSDNSQGIQNDELYEACMELETLLIKNLIKGMRSTVEKSGFIDTGFAGEIYEDMLYDEYSKTFARNANFGFAKMAYEELSRLR